MLQPSRKLVFAIEAVLDIALNGADRPVRSSEVTERQGIPRRYLEQVLQHMVRAGILAGVRGPRGGYRLARERRRVTLADVVRVVDEMDADNRTEEALGATPLREEVVGPVLHRFQEDAMAWLGEVSVETLCRSAEEAGLVERNEVVPDFSI